MKKLLGIVVLSLLWFNTAFALPTCVGEDSSKWTMCEGTKAFNNDLTYTGEWKDGKHHGKGTLLLPNGAKYLGEWVGETHLKIKTKNGNDAIINTYSGMIIEGEFKDSDIKKGLINGQVTATNPKGDKWIGGFIDGKLNGQGTYISANGAIYNGEYKNDKKNGKGAFISSNEEKYVGEWKDDLKHGQGTLTSSDGSKYAGEFKDGKFIK